MKRLLLSTVVLCALTGTAIAQENETLLVSNAEHLEKTGWGVYKSTNKPKCMLRSTQNEYTLSLLYPSDNMKRLGNTFMFTGAVNVAHDSWSFSDISQHYLNVIIKLNNTTITDTLEFTTKYEANYIESDSGEATPLNMRMVSQGGVKFIEYIVDLQDQPDIKFDMNGMNDLIPDYISCIENLS